MNHQNIYESIIKKAQSQNRVKLRKNQEDYIYYDDHHILPKCLNGTNERENLVLLTAKEHYVCHKLLTYIYHENRKIACAFHKMSFSKRYGTIISSRDYEYARKLLSIIPVSVETCKKLSKVGKGRPSSKKGKSFDQLFSELYGEEVGLQKSVELKQKIRENSKDRKCSKETIEKHKTHIPWNKGKKDCFSKETLEKMSKSHLGIKCHDEEFKKHLGINNVLYKTGTTHSSQTKEKMRMSQQKRREREKL